MKTNLIYYLAPNIFLINNYIVFVNGCVIKMNYCYVPAPAGRPNPNPKPWGAEAPVLRGAGRVALWPGRAAYPEGVRVSESG